MRIQRTTYQSLGPLFSSPSQHKFREQTWNRLLSFPWLQTTVTLSALTTFCNWGNVCTNNILQLRKRPLRRPCTNELGYHKKLRCLAQLVAEVGWLDLESCRDYFCMNRNTWPCRWETRWNRFKEHHWILSESKSHSVISTAWPFILVTVTSLVYVDVLWVRRLIQTSCRLDKNLVRKMKKEQNCELLQMSYRFGSRNGLM
jgi:hypothetical protein